MVRKRKKGVVDAGAAGALGTMTILSFFLLSLPVLPFAPLAKHTKHKNKEVFECPKFSLCVCREDQNSYPFKSPISREKISLSSFIFQKK